MTTCIALLRGINVGGKNTLPMKELVAILENTGSRRVKTYIQSGNAVFKSGEKDFLKLSNQIGLAIRQRCGFKPYVLILTFADIRAAIANNPFSEAEADPKAVHLGFLATVPECPQLAALSGLKKDSEDFRLLDNRFYLYAPEGVGGSKLSANAERLLGVPMTSRNWKTVGKLRDIARDLEGSR